MDRGHKPIYVYNLLPQNKHGRRPLRRLEEVRILRRSGSDKWLIQLFNHGEMVELGPVFCK